MTDDALPGDGALAEISSSDLSALARAIADGHIPAPFSPASLTYAHLGHLARALSPFAGLDASQLLALAGAILAERKRAARTALELVWSGSDSGPSYARYTKIVVPELIARAERQITIAGYSFDRGAGVFEGLRDAMHQRGVAVRLFLDIEQLAASCLVPVRVRPLKQRARAPRGRIS